MRTRSISPLDSTGLHRAATLDGIVSPVESEVAQSETQGSPVHVHDFAGSPLHARALRREDSRSPEEPLGVDLSTLTAVFGGEAVEAMSPTEHVPRRTRDARGSVEVEDLGMDLGFLNAALAGEFIAIESDDGQKPKEVQVPAAATATATATPSVAETALPVVFDERVAAHGEFSSSAFEPKVEEESTAAVEVRNAAEPAELTFDRVEELYEEQSRTEALPRPSFSSIFGLNRQQGERVHTQDEENHPAKKDDKWKKVRDWARRVSVGKPLDDFSRLPEDRAPNPDADAIPPPTRGSDISHRTTSTRRYQAKYGDDYIPSAELHERVLDLCRSLWVGRPDSDFVITKLRGGGFHRIASIVVKPPTSTIKSSVGTLKRKITKLVKKPGHSLAASEQVFINKFAHGEFILRVPRPPTNRQNLRDYDYAQMRRNHDFAEGCGIEVPRVVHIETTHENPLGTRYVLMEKLTGQRLDRMMHRLTTAQKCDVAADLGKICRTMFDQQRRFMGTVSAQAGDMSVTEPEWLRRGNLHSSALYPFADIVTLGLHHVLRRQTVPRPDLLPSLQTMAAEVEKMGAFGAGWRMTHGDFYPRNVLITIDKTTQKAKVSGIIDWDTLAFLPAVCAAKPPSWLWQADFYPICGDEDNLDVFAQWSASQHATYLQNGFVVSDSRPLPSIEEERLPEDLLIKNAFDVAAGGRYCRVAYHAFAFEARKLSSWAFWQMDKTMSPDDWVRWVEWWTANWKGFRDLVEVYGWPVDRHGLVAQPPIFQDRWRGGMV